MGGPNKMELKKGPWTREEDQKLLAFIEQHGYGSWRTLPTKAGLQRCGKSCRLRWTNYLRPDIKRGKFSTHEEKAIIRLHALLGNRWSAIAVHLPKRTDNEIKNYWNTRLKKRLTRMGIDPATHKPKNNQAGSAALSHMAQWEAARLEAEARLTRQSKLLRSLSSSSSSRPPPRCLDVLRVWQSNTNIPSCFFSSSSSSLESPTSTLIVGNDGASKVYGELTRAQLHEDDIVYNYPCESECGARGPVEVASLNQDSHGDSAGGPLVGEVDDSTNFWNYLLDLVSSPMMELPAL